MARRKDRPAGPLESRSAAILRAIIEEYIATATPVGSQVLVERVRPGRQLRDGPQRDGGAGGGRLPAPSPHERGARADGRRLPAVRGVDRRTDPAGAGRAADDPPPVRPGRVRQRPVVPPRGLDARGRHPVGGLATPAKPQACRVRRVDLVGNGARTASLLLVLAEGPVKQTLITLDEPLSQEDLEHDRADPGRGARRLRRRRPSRRGWTASMMPTAIRRSSARASPSGSCS